MIIFFEIDYSLFFVFYKTLTFDIKVNNTEYHYQRILFKGAL